MPTQIQSLWDFMTWQFLVSAIVINAILLRVYRAVKIGKPTLANSTWFKVLMTMGNFILGVLLAIPKSFLFGKTFTERVLVGLCAGATSQVIYSLFLKRLIGEPKASAPTTAPPPTPAISGQYPSPPPTDNDEGETG